MKKIFEAAAAIFLFISLGSQPAHAQWTSLSQNLPEASIQSIAVDPKNPKLIYAGSDRRVYKSADGGDSWRQILGVRGADNQVKFIYLDPEKPHHIYIATLHGIEYSREGGKHWESLYRGVGDKSKAVFCIARSVHNPKILWVGTANGPVTLNSDGGDLKMMGGLPNAAVYSILMNDKMPDFILITTEKGIYKSKDNGIHWERVSVNGASSPEPEEGRIGADLQQFNIEEMSSAPFLSNVIYLEGQNKFYSATKKGILESSKEAGVWTALKGRGLPDEKVNFLMQSLQTFYVATDRGVFQWDLAKETLKDASDGLESKEVKTLFYDAATDALFAGTRKGLFKWAHPEFELAPLVTGAGEKDSGMIFIQVRNVLKRFGNEPSIREIQNAAIQYAEVHPKKIEEWRAAAARRAWFPNLSVNRSFGIDQNVDIDRGGTADPDKFIIGPKENNDDWSVGAGWNLGELIWNDDQTSIDTRSRLLVELRDDILTKVTHLYYERRRLQVDMAMTPAVDVTLRVEKEIRLEELTAGIDSLTGGYLSKHIDTGKQIGFPPSRK